jgi:YspA, cpYpsA-related SLOG family
LDRGLTLRVLVCGGRDYDDLDWVFQVLDDIGVRHIIHGASYLGRRNPRCGADYLADVYGEKRCIPTTRYPADWSKHGKAAGPIRNQQMLDESRPRLVVAFPGGRGTADMVRRAKAAGVRVREIKAKARRTITDKSRIKA